MKSAGKVNNSANSGKTTDEIVEIWNVDHSNNVIIPAGEPEPNPS